MNRIKKWWYSERIGRAEAGTSQDVCPTNGGAVIFLLVMLIVWSPALIIIFV